jgi:sugar/nucleoside kinase (ribokinase family)
MRPGMASGSNPAVDVITLGVHVLDIVVRPVDTIPSGQGAALVEDIHIGPAGTAGGTALVLARLGAAVRTVGVVGEDLAGHLLRELLAAAGVDTGGIQVRGDLATSASVIPARSDGSRPALHLVGANAALNELAFDESVLAGAGYLHIGGGELFPEVAGRALRAARARGVVTSLDLLVPGEAGWWDNVAALLPFVDVVLPNEQQVLGITGTDDLEVGCRRLLAGGARCVVATAGAAGALVVEPAGSVRVPAFDVEVVDTTGCGDAFSAGFLRARSLGFDVGQAARMGCAVAAQVAQGSGTDAGAYDLASVAAVCGVVLPMTSFPEERGDRL